MNEAPEASELFPPSPSARFSDWPNVAVPAVAAGVYTVWRGEQFIYVGMAGRGLAAEDLRLRTSAGSATGLRSRLASHASGRRSGDQFCIYVADRLVLPSLTVAQLGMISSGEHSLDAIVRTFVHSELTYRFIQCGDGPTAAAVERRLRAGVAGVRPLLNPLRAG